MVELKPSILHRVGEVPAALCQPGDAAGTRVVKTAHLWPHRLHRAQRVPRQPALPLPDAAVAGVAGEQRRPAGRPLVQKKTPGRDGTGSIVEALSTLR